MLPAHALAKVKLRAIDNARVRYLAKINGFDFHDSRHLQHTPTTNLATRGRLAALRSSLRPD